MLTLCKLLKGRLKKKQDVGICLDVCLDGESVVQHPLLGNHVTYLSLLTRLVALPVIPPPSPPMHAIQVSQE